LLPEVLVRVQLVTIPFIASKPALTAHFRGDEGRIAYKKEDGFLILIDRVVESIPLLGWGIQFLIVVVDIDVQASLTDRMGLPQNGQLMLNQVRWFRKNKGLVRYY